MTAVTHYRLKGITIHGQHPVRASPATFCGAQVHTRATRGKRNVVPWTSDPDQVTCPKCRAMLAEARPREHIFAKSGAARAHELTRIVKAVSRALVRELGRADLCIAATRILTQLLPDSRPLAVRVAAFNGRYMELIERTGRPPESANELRLWTDELGAWSVGIGYEGFHRPGRWDGHLVALTADRYLLDATLDQASRPDRDMVLEPHAVGPVPVSFLSGRQPLFLTADDTGHLGCVRYQRFADRHWRGSPDWHNQDGRLDPVLATLRFELGLPKRPAPESDVR